jgi:hypothetical protein
VKTKIEDTREECRFNNKKKKEEEKKKKFFADWVSKLKSQWEIAERAMACSWMGLVGQ